MCSGTGGVPVIAAGAQMRGDALALEKDLDGARRQPDLDFAAGEAVGHAVKMRLDLDMVIEADAAQAQRRPLTSDFIPEQRATSSRNAERDQIGMPGDIIPESRATSVGIGTLKRWCMEMPECERFYQPIEPYVVAKLREDLRTSPSVSSDRQPC
jgi:hypothetical protein